ncbi:MAG TPA: sigma-54 dependent transcriptional regulator, partial [Candidatus Eisenbacteria bacterium]|nr:sigma-54 dependent transcriptional regulator [Candidatus Eisenbacteria bacterium]
EHGNFEVVLTDLYLGGNTALDLIARLRNIRPHLPVIIMTAKHTTETAITATQHGAYDYFPKPDAFDFDLREGRSWPWVLELAAMIESAAASHRLTAKVRLPEDTTFTYPKLEGDRMVGKSRSMQEVFKAIGRVAASDLTVLIRGETGTGKELAARALYSHGARASQPFVVVNSAAIPENLLESELFGHEKGAFTDAQARRIGRFEQANQGTIFLDEIGDMSFSVQQKLLRVLQEKTLERVGGKETIQVDVRVIAATHRNLELAIRENEFRPDLYYRLNVTTIAMPALRERPEDIPDLVRYFLAKHGAAFGATNPLITSEAMHLLEQHLWPGNVRQLRNVVRKALLLARGFVITREIIEQAFAQMITPRPPVDQSFPEYISHLLSRAQKGELENVMEAVTDMANRELYAQAINRAGGDQSQAARWLGVSRPTMLEKLKRFGLHPSQH